MGRRKGTGVWGMGGGTEPLEKNWWVNPYGVVWVNSIWCSVEVILFKRCT